MLILGLILCIVGWLTGIGVLYSVGWILVVVGLILLLLGGIGHPIGGRNWWY